MRRKHNPREDLVFANPELARAWNGERHMIFAAEDVVDGELEGYLDRLQNLLAVCASESGFTEPRLSPATTALEMLAFVCDPQFFGMATGMRRQARLLQIGHDLDEKGVDGALRSLSDIVGQLNTTAHDHDLVCV